MVSAIFPLFGCNWLSSVLPGIHLSLANIKYFAGRRSPAAYCAVNEVADAILVARRESEHTLKISSSMSPPKNISLDLPLLWGNALTYLNQLLCTLSIMRNIILTVSKTRSITGIVNRERA